MAVIGCLGDIAFEASDETARTIENMVWSGSARYATHQRHLTNALTEFTGLDPDTITFDITLSAELGTDPMEEAVKIWNIERSGAPVALTIGTHAYGKWAWNIIKHKLKATAHYRNGDLHTVTVSVTLQEYLRE